MSNADRSTMRQAFALEPLTETLAECVESMQLSPEQERFVASNEESLHEWRRDPELKPMAIVAGGAVVGFVMYEESADDDGTIEFNIFRLMIDRPHQGRGYGRKAMQAVIARISTDPRRHRITTCFVPENQDARRLYASLGFIEIELDDDGEIIAELVRPTLG
jgi:diamine N-acetyltransferase